MKREDKIALVDALSQRIVDNKNFYLADISELDAEKTVELRKLCYDNGIEMTMSKNTFLKIAFEKANINDEELFGTLIGSSSIMFSESINAPAKLIKAFRKKSEKPVLKAAFIEDNLYVGDENLNSLAMLKTREELIADVVALLGSPIRNLISALDAGGKVMSVLETLSNREQ